MDVIEELLFNKNLLASDKVLYMAILSSHDLSHDISNDLLAKKLNLSSRSISRGISRLVKEGYLKSKMVNRKRDFVPLKVTEEQHKALIKMTSKNGIDDKGITYT